MLEWLLVFAGVNLALGAAVVLPPLVRRERMFRRLGVASVPMLWALVMSGVYLYLRATIPTSPVVIGPDGMRMLKIRKEWEDQANTASFQAFCLTVATVLSVLATLLTHNIRTRRRHTRFA